MSTTLALPETAEADSTPAEWFSGLEASPRRAARRLGVLLMVLMIAALAVGTAAFVWQANEPALATTMTAPADDGGGALFRARLEPRRHRVLLTPVGGFGAVGDRRARAVWMMRTYGPPVPLGVVDPRRATVLVFDRSFLPDGNPPTHLFVTLEAPGAAAADYPKGPTAAEGVLPPA